ncbi:MAG: hypothetical protein ACKVHE_09985, partial [Planctomycetales bacterium]
RQPIFNKSPKVSDGPGEAGRQERRKIRPDGLVSNVRYVGVSGIVDRQRLPVKVTCVCDSKSGEQFSRSRFTACGNGGFLEDEIVHHTPG